MISKVVSNVGVVSDNVTFATLNSASTISQVMILAIIIHLLENRSSNFFLSQPLHSQFV